MLPDVFAFAVKARWNKNIKTEAAFELHVWAYMREYFTSGDVGAFIDSMANEIENQWMRAWREGAALAGVDPADFEPEDNDLIESYIRSEIEYVLPLAEDIDQAITDGLTDKEFNDSFRHRPPMWANRYNNMVDIAKLHFSGNRVKFVWELGPTEEHCETGSEGVGCLDLAGIVMYNYEWEEANIAPQANALACHGFRCGCRLNQTNARRTTGGLARVLDLMTSANV